MEQGPFWPDLSANFEVEVYSCFWLLAMAPAWTATIYTFSDTLWNVVRHLALARQVWTNRFGPCRNSFEIPQHGREPAEHSDYVAVANSQFDGGTKVSVVCDEDCVATCSRIEVP